MMWTRNWPNDRDAKMTYRRPNRPELYSMGQRIVKELVQRWGVVVALEAGRLKIWNATIGNDGEFLDVPDAAFDLLADHRDAVWYYLQEEERRVAMFQAAWWTWDTNGYRDECRS